MLTTDRVDGGGVWLTSQPHRTVHSPPLLAVLAEQPASPNVQESIPELGITRLTKCLFKTSANDPSLAAVTKISNREASWGPDIALPITKTNIAF